MTTERSEKIVYTPEYQTTCDKAQLEVGLWLAAWIAFDWMFGKRRNEISKLIRKDIWTEKGYLYTRFFVGKKRSRTALVDQLPYTKRKTLKHKGAHYVLEYLEEYDFEQWQKEHPKEEIDLDKFLEERKTSPEKFQTRQDGYIFPSNREATTLTVHTKFKNKQGIEETRAYTYPKLGGYIDPSLVYYYIRKVNPHFWPHLGRHTVATRAAEDGATEYDISNILDVSPRTASKYVHHGTKLTERWSDQTT